MSDLRERCERLFQEARFAEADELARLVLASDPDDGWMWQAHGAARWYLKDFAAARAALETATCLAPLRPLARLALADSYARTDSSDLARFLYAGIGEDEEFPTALLPRVAVGLGRLGDWERAAAVCASITERDPTHHQAYFGLAFYLSRLGAPPARLIPPLAMALDLAPDVLQYRINLGLLWAAAGSDDRAYALLADVPPAEVCHACWLRRMAALFDRVGDAARAASCRVRTDG